jgi:predicted ArsR family transcriptional regulator
MIPTTTTGPATTTGNDEALLDLLRRRGPLGIAELSQALSVTATAVRQRLGRIVGQGLVEREALRAGRGRPSYRYRLSEKGYRRSGNNFAELAAALWEEVRQIRDLEVRRGLLRRLVARMRGSMLDGLQGDGLQGNDAQERMSSLAGALEERGVAAEVRAVGGLPVLSVLACPYPGLADQDRAVCAMERMLFSELLEHDVKLAECRLDGDACCRFELSGAAAATEPVST